MDIVDRLITVNNPRTDTGKPVFMTDLEMHLYRLCDDILEYNDTKFRRYIRETKCGQKQTIGTVEFDCNLFPPCMIFHF